MYQKFAFPVVLILLLCGGCKKNSAPVPDNTSPAGNPLFTLLPAASTGIHFRNDLVYDKDFNIYTYRNFYNGGGVGIGDVNRDGLPDVFFSSNMGQNRLYLNHDNFKFEDVTDKAGVAGKGSWSTGVSMADVNGDGWLDIYVCNSGNPREEEKSQPFSRENELFINNHDGTFTERAAEYGLNEAGLTTHAAFFDYDHDGDLDVYILNNSFRPIGSFDLRRNLRMTRDSLGGHKLLRNDGGYFTDVSVKAGIMGSVIAFGLGVTVGDLDQDGWQDIYVSNDFFERDYLYHNNHDGTFSEVLEKEMRHISAASMGADMADINNDAFPDIFVTDMLPEPDRRIKTTTSFDSPDRFRYTTGTGYYNQFTRNMLHLNNGDGSFSEIACLASAEATDWSWGALLLDMDNDGWRDIYVANGIAQDLTNQDYLMFASDPSIQQEIINGGHVDFKRLIDSIPSEKVPNYAFRNNGNLTFSNVAPAWGLAQPSFSNGSAYGDLDNDGDLDLVVNNVNMDAFVYRNEADKQLKDNHFLKFELQGEGQNTAAFGAKVFLRTGGKTFYQEQMPMRGFQSSMDPRPNLGVGALTVVDTVLIVWPTGKKSTLLTQVPTNQVLKLTQAQANAGPADLSFLRPPAGKPFQDVTATVHIPWAHRESTFYDWDRDRLLFFLYSTEGPRLATGDVNGDGREDFFAGGAKGQPGAIFLQTADGHFQPTKQPALDADADCEDVDAALFDADGDGDLDMYVASGSNEAEPLSKALADRLYVNDGQGHFSRKANAVPGQKPFATACVRPADLDGDGDLDLFVGMRLLPGKVGQPVGGFLLINDGKGYFNMQQTDVLKNLGMPTDATWADVDGDKDPDLIVVGEWMPIRVFLNDKGQLRAADTGLGQTAGLWNRIPAGDFNGDGKVDFLVGNNGLNSRLDASAEQPLCLFFNDFDKNGTYEQLLNRYNDGQLVPFALRGDLVGNMPVLKKKYLHYRRYAGQRMTDIFTPEQMKDAVELQVTTLASGVLLNLGNGRFSFTPLPSEAQFAPMYGITIGDFDGDGKLDALTGGNFLGNKPEFGYEDADYGLFLQGDGQGGFTPQRSRETGFRLDGEVRDIKTVQLGGKTYILAARNNQELAVFKTGK